jgi:hypothetical protein
MTNSGWEDKQLRAGKIRFSGDHAAPGAAEVVAAYF